MATTGYTRPCLHIMMTALAMLVLLPIVAAFALGHSSSLRRHSAPTSTTATVLHAEKTALMGMGCFWKPSETMLSVPGVTSTMAGYSGKVDATKPPAYSDVCASRDWVEAVRVTFDDEQITYPELLDAYFETQEAKPGYRQYAPIIFACGEEQMAESQAWVAKAREEGRVGNGGIPALAVAVEPAPKFYKAENYHQTFWQKNRPRFALGVMLLAVSSGALNSIIPSNQAAGSTSIIIFRNFQILSPLLDHILTAHFSTMFVLRLLPLLSLLLAAASGAASAVGATAGANAGANASAPSMVDPTANASSPILYSNSSTVRGRILPSVFDDKGHAPGTIGLSSLFLGLGAVVYLILAGTKGKFRGFQSKATKFVIVLLEKGFWMTKGGNVKSSAGLDEDDVLLEYGRELEGVKKEQFLKMTKDEQKKRLGKSMADVKRLHGTDGKKGGGLVWREDWKQNLELGNVVSASFGSSHCAAIDDLGSLYVWGSSTSGKLGLGHGLTDSLEFYIASPRPLRLPIKGANGIVRKVSCGSNHSACISSQGQLYVWGSGVGGKLGVGHEMLMEQHTPRLVKSLLHESIADVSCGGLQTLASTAISTNMNAKGRKEVAGGRLYCAGPYSCLGNYCPEFTHVPLQVAGADNSSLANKIIRIRQMSAGHCHQAVVSTTNELYCWGRNDNGCCGQDPRCQNFIDRPTILSSVYEKAQNLSLRKPCRQSSIYGNRTAHNAVDGNIDGCSAFYSQTQIDPQPFWEVDLQDLCSVTSIKIWSCIEDSSIGKDGDGLIQKLVPFWIIASRQSLNDDGRGLEDAVGGSELRLEVTKGVQEFEWILPFDSVCRYVRIQKEGYESLRLCQVEVFGYRDTDRVNSPVLSATAGRDVTAVILSSVAPDTGQLVRAFKNVIAVK